MSADEIKFPPAERRDAKQFEVPPWEQKQFDELQARRGAAQPADEADDALRTQAASEPVERSPAGSDGLAARLEREAARSGTGGATAEASAQADGAGEAMVDAMMAQLAAEEASAGHSIERVRIASAAVVVLIGCVLVVWGVAAFVSMRRTGATGAFGGAVLVLFGAGFVAGGVWIAAKHLRDQGVL